MAENVNNRPDFTCCVTYSVPLGQLTTTLAPCDGGLGLPGHTAADRGSGALVNGQFLVYCIHHCSWAHSCFQYIIEFLKQNETHIMIFHEIPNEYLF